MSNTDIPFNKTPNKQASPLANVFKLVMGTVFAQVLTIITTPILTRLYGPNNFGTAALFSSIVVLISGISCMCYERSILLPKSDEEAVNLLGVSLVILFFVTVFCFLIIFLGNRFLSGWLESTGIRSYIWLMPIAIFFSGLFFVLNYWNTRTKHFGRLAISRVSSAITADAFQLSRGFLGFTSAGSLIVGDILGSFVSNLNLALRVWRENIKFFLLHINLKDMLKGFKRHKKFPLFLSWSTLINSLSVQLPIIFLATFFSAPVVGQYALGYRLLQVPMNLVGDAIKQVFSQRAAVMNLEGKLNFLVESTFKRLFLITVFPSFLLALFGKEIFIVFFGQRWAEAGVYTQILSFWTFFVFIGAPISSLNSIIERQEISLILNILFIVTRFISIVVGGLMKNIYVALILFSFSGVLVWIVVILWYFFLTGASIKKTSVDIARNILPAFALLMIILSIKILYSQKIAVPVFAGIILTPVYYMFLLKNDSALQKEVFFYLSKLKFIKNKDIGT